MNDSLNLMQSRLRYRGGEAQQDRMIKDKRETLDRVVNYSYQGNNVRKLDSENIVRALINPNQVKQNYDDKIISIGYEHDFKPGTIFEWVRTNTKWLVYLQELTELAYFKGDIRKCTHQVSWKDGDEIKNTYLAVRGPVETKIDSTIKEGNSIDTPNHTLNILMPANEDTLSYFRRYAKFYLTPLALGDSPICWRVEATDTISMPGILEITASEYYINEETDNVEEGLVDTYVEPIPQPQDATIEGLTFIRPKLSYTYEYKGSENGEWSFDKRLPIDAVVNGKTITITWKTTYTGEFVLQYGTEEKTIVVESLF